MLIGETPSISNFQRKTVVDLPGVLADADNCVAATVSHFPAILLPASTNDFPQSTWRLSASVCAPMARGIISIHQSIDHSHFAPNNSTSREFRLH